MSNGSCESSRSVCLCWIRDGVGVFFHGTKEGGGIYFSSCGVRAESNRRGSQAASCRLRSSERESKFRHLPKGNPARNRPVCAEVKLAAARASTPLSFGMDDEMAKLIKATEYGVTKPRWRVAMWSSLSCSSKAIESGYTACAWADYPNRTREPGYDDGHRSRGSA